jgi:hypothetical protein
MSHGGHRQVGGCFQILRSSHYNISKNIQLENTALDPKANSSTGNPVELSLIILSGPD